MVALSQNICWWGLLMLLFPPYKCRSTQHGHISKMEKLRKLVTVLGISMVHNWQKYMTGKEKCLRTVLWLCLVTAKVLRKYSGWYWNQNVTVQYQNCFVGTRVHRKISLYSFCVHFYVSSNKNWKIVVSLRLGPYFWGNFYFCCIRLRRSLHLQHHHR